MPDKINLDAHLELISSFKDLLSDVKGNLDVLKLFDDILNDEIESVSGSGSSDNTVSSELSISPPLNDAAQLVDYSSNFISQEHFKPLITELEGMFKTRHRKYTWLSKFNIPYKFGGVSHAASQILNFENVIKIMNTLNEEFNSELDSCLVARYTTKEHALSAHQDNEVILDQSSPICNISIGPTRSIVFSKEDGATVMEFDLENGSLLKMNPGCQSELLHRVLPGEDDSTVRYALSFRKLNPDSRPKSPSAPPHPPPKMLQAPSLHPSRSHDNSLWSPYPGTSENEEADKHSGSCHLIIGDSLTRGLNIKDTIILTKGGAHPKDILPLLHSKHDVLEPSKYAHMKSVTICVGTNALNVTKSHYIPMINILADYNNLVSELLKLFPNAKIGLFNVLPRVCYYRDTYNRIGSFNMFLMDHIASVYDRIQCIVLYWEFVDSEGHLRPDLYNKDDFLHLSPQGNDLMADCIAGYQIAVLPMPPDIELY